MPGYLLAANLKETYPEIPHQPAPFQFKNNAFVRILDDDMLLTILRAIRDGKLLQYDLEEDERRDRVARENYISQQGRQEGWQQGRQEGWQQGRQQGRQEVALDMLRGKEPLDKIVTYSKLTMEQIKQLGKENGLL